MANRIELNGESFLTWRETPWDEKIFQLKTVELLDLSFVRECDGFTLLKDFESQAHPDLCYFRINSKEIENKAILVKSGYLQCETAFKISLPNLQAYISPVPIKLLPLNEIGESDFSEVYGNLEGMYKFSRFHEDPIIPVHLADNRMRSWIEDMEKRKVSGLLYKTESNILVAYMFYEVVGDDVNLILGGAVPGKNMYAPVFWASLIDHFKHQGIKKLSTTISAINDGVLSLYLRLGFRISKSQIDFHKHYRRLGCS